MDFLKRKPNNIEPSINSSIEKPIKLLVEQKENYIQARTIDDIVSNTQNDNSNIQSADTLSIQIPKKPVSDLLVKKVDHKIEPSVLDKKIEMKYIKDGRSYRTFVFNLELYIKNNEILDKLINKMKKSFGTQCAYKETEFGFAYGFAGDLAPRIKQYLIDSKLFVQENFK
jgi:translation initiation factor 1 (eIF-1/SUI1)